MLCVLKLSVHFLNTVHACRKVSVICMHCKKKRKFCKKFPSHIKDQSLGLKGSLDPFNVREESLNGKGINWASLKSKGSFQSRGLYFLREVSRDKNKGNIPGPGNNPLCIRAKSREVYN